MKLLRKINNNAAVAQDNRGREMVVLGRGVGFHPMPYELTDLSVVYRTFYDVDPQYYEILSNLPEDALLAAADITEQAEITLHTGRTHQIRAQMAAAGWPLLGDGKYGKLDKRYDRKFQALYSYKLTFQFTTDAECLSYLNGRTFQVESVDFVQEYFT